MTEKNYRALSWDDTFIPTERMEELEQFTLLPEGEYTFTVESLERKQYQPKPGGKLPACNMAVVKLRIDSDVGRATVQHRLYLHEKMFSSLREFFASVGMSDASGLRIDWDNLPGATGRCKIGHRQYDGKNYHECTGFLPAQTRAPQPPQAPAIPPVADDDDIPF